MREPTPEQANIIEAAVHSTDNLIVNALAGTGKTTTIEMICHAVQGIPILYLVFNKRNQVEAEKRMHSHVECRTQNSLGHRVWQQACGRRLVLASDKMRTILKNEIADLKRADKEEAWEDYSETLKLISKAKQMGYVPQSWSGPHRAVYNTAIEWTKDLDLNPTSLQMQLINNCLIKSIMAAYEGGIEFQDQIYMPILFGGPWPKFPLVIVDEFQDWDPLGHMMLDQLVSKRLIGVGDPWQSIYGFKRAVTNGMALMRDKYNMKEFPLSVTWRVPKVGVSRANERVSWYKAAETNAEGEVNTLSEWGPDDIVTDAAIICRNNGPLISLGFRLLAAGKPINMVGFDIGAGLIRILKKLGPAEMTEQLSLNAIDKWTNNQLSLGKSEESVWDRAECLKILVRNRVSLKEAIVGAEALFQKSNGRIHLMSGHKAKGLEFDVVFHLDPWRIPSRFAVEGTETWEQELNIKYVVETRFKNKLFLVNSENFIDINRNRRPGSNKSCF